MRIQILPLPMTIKNGEVIEDPFALVIDQWPHDRTRPVEERVEDAKAWGAFAEQCGARTIIATRETVEIIDPYEADPEPDPEEAQPEPAATAAAIYAVFYGKRMRIDWPDGPPPGLDRRKLNDHLNENVAAAMQPAASDALDSPCFDLLGDEDCGVGLHCRDHFGGGRPLAYLTTAAPSYPDKAVPTVRTIPQLRAAAASHLAEAHDVTVVREAVYDELKASLDNDPPEANEALAEAARKLREQ